MLLGRRFLQKPTVSTRKQRFEKAASFSTSSILSSTAKPIIQPSYSPCLLFGYEFVSLDDGTGKICYTFYSLKDKKIIQRKKSFSPRDIMWPKHATLVGSSHGWLGFCDLSLPDSKDKLNVIYLTNPSLPFCRNHYNSIQCCHGVNKMAFSSSPQIHHENIKGSYSMLAIDDKWRIADGSNDCNEIVYFNNHKGFCDLSLPANDSYDSLNAIYPTNPSLPFCHNHYNFLQREVNEMLFSSPPQIYHVDIRRSSKADVSNHYDQIVCFNNDKNIRRPYKADVSNDYDEIVYFNNHKRFYRLSYQSGLGAFLPRDRSIYLVESSGNLFAVKRKYDHRDKYGKLLKQSKTVGVEVYKMNFEQKKWEDVYSIGDNALFVRRNDSFSFCTRDFPYLRSNSVYFAEYYYRYCDDVTTDYRPWRAEIFSLDDEGIERLDVNVCGHNHPLIWIMVDIDAM